MFKKSIAPLVVGLAMAVIPAMSGAEDQTEAAAQPEVPNIFNSSAWGANTGSGSAGGYDWSNLAQMFSAPTNMQPLNLATPGGYAAFMNPGTYAQMMNPAFYAQMMSPGFYTQFLSPSNWLSWMDPRAYAPFIDPNTYMTMMNPMAYMQFMNPMTYLQWANLNNYAPFINPMTYTQWFDPSAYQFSGAAGGAPSGANWFNPSAWTQGAQPSNQQ